MTASALHTPEEMRRLVEAIVDVSTRIPLLEGNEAAASKVATVMPGAGITSAGSNGSAH